MKCKECKYKSACYMKGYDKMVRKQCLLEKMADVLKIKQETLLERINDFCVRYDVYTFSYFIPQKVTKEDIYGVISYGDYSAADWGVLTKEEKECEVYDIINRFRIRWNVLFKKYDIKLCVAALDCYYGTLPDSGYTYCAGCGAIIDNSAKNNKRYCDSCIAQKRRKSSIIACVDCGFEFTRKSNREHRCYDCQQKRNKELNAARVQKYRKSV